MSGCELQLAGYKDVVDERLARWREENFCARLWAKDHKLWSTEPLAELSDRLGWLELPQKMLSQVQQLSSFADEIKAEGFKHVVLFGMGGSSLAPEMFQKTFANASGRPQLIVLDSTHPQAVRDVEQMTDVQHTLYIVSSKSGTTTETLSFFRYFWQLTAAKGKNFVAITDPGSSLEQLAEESNFLRVFYGLPEVGGRYSALSFFGLLPAALIGVDLNGLAASAKQMATNCGADVAADKNPGLHLGAALGELAIAGRDKLALIAHQELAAFPYWIEQLIAESTGKQGKGIVPLLEKAAGAFVKNAEDRFYIFLDLAGKDDAELEKALNLVKTSGQPYCRLTLDELNDLAGEFFRWEVATAAAGAVLGINPFDQPDVQLAKDLARQAMAQQQQSGKTGKEMPGVDVAESQGSMKEFLKQAKKGDYIAVQAYLCPDSNNCAKLMQLKSSLAQKARLAVTLGIGPRFLHSTGQLHKGGADNGLFLQLVDEPALKLDVPQTDYSFNRLLRAQADGDLAALAKRGRRLLRIELGRDGARGLGDLIAILNG